jgi:Holliday junction resolvase RusA-like endonuclease
MGADRDESAGPVELLIEGPKPKTQGSMRAFPFRRRDGSLGVRVTHDGGRQVEDWRLAVRLIARQQWQRPPTRGPVKLAVLIRVPRPKSHYRRSGLSAQGRRQRRPGRLAGDVDKLLRAVCDALTGIVYEDDAQVVEALVRKVWAEDRDGTWRTAIWIAPAED